MSLSVNTYYTEFWGTIIDTYSPRELEESFGVQIVMACIYINDKIPSEDSDHSFAVLWVEKENHRYQVCRLSQKLRQQPLNLIFEEGSMVRFYNDGNAPIYIYGYALGTPVIEDLCLKAEEHLSTPPTSVNNKSPLGKYSHIIDTTCYTISDGDSKGSEQDDQFCLSATSDSEFDYTSESTPRSVSLGSSTSNESPRSNKKLKGRWKRGLTSNN